MRKLIVCIVLTLTLPNVFGQESNNGKKLWAESFLNKKAPEFTVEEWISQQPKMKGKFVLIDFWATWCTPCLKAIPELNEFAKKFKKKLVVIGISNEPADREEHEKTGYRILLRGRYQRSNDENTWGECSSSRDFDRSERYCSLGRLSFIGGARVNGRDCRENNEKI